MTNGLVFCYIFAKSEKRKAKSEERRGMGKLFKMDNIWS